MTKLGEVIQNKFFIISLLISSFGCGYYAGNAQYYRTNKIKKEYLYIDIEKVMSSLVDHYKEKELSRKDISTNLASKQKELAELLKQLEEKYIVFATPKVVSGATNITNQVIKKLTYQEGVEE